MRKHQHSQEPHVQLSGCRLTEYQDQFPDRCISAVKQHTGDYHTLEGKTTFRSDHGTPGPTQKPPNISKPYYVLPSECHERCTSTYVADYPPRTPEKHIMTPTWNYCPPTAKMFLQSLYKDEYKAWNTQKRQPNKLRDNLKLTGKFATTTTFKDAYCKVRENFKPALTPMRPTPPHLDGTTTYRTHYITYPVERKPREKPTYQPNSDPLTRVYTCRQDYKGLPAEPAKPFKPKVTWGKIQSAIDSTSEFNDQHKTRPVEPKFHHKREGHVPPPDVYLSTAHADYNAHKCRRPESARRPPVQAWPEHKGPFDARSTMQEDFKNWSTL